MDKQDLEKKAFRHEEIAELVKQIKAGDKDAFQPLYECTWRTVYYILFNKVHNKPDALMLLNEVYTEAYARIQSIENEQAFVKWLIRVAHIRGLEFMKLKYRLSVEEPVGTIVGEDIEEQDVSLIPERDLLSQETREIILQAVEKLPRTQRDAIFMFYYQDLTVSEIADITDCSENTIYKRLHDAKNSLKLKLEQIISKGVSLYGAADFYFLKEIFEKDIESCTSKISQAATWAAIAGQIGIAVPAATAVAPVVAQNVATVAKAAGAAVVNTAMIKTVVLGVLAATAAVTVAVMVPKVVRTPVEIEQPVYQSAGVLENIPEDTVDLQEGSGFELTDSTTQPGEVAEIPEPSPEQVTAGTAGIEPEPHRQATAVAEPSARQGARSETGNSGTGSTNAARQANDRGQSTEPAPEEEQSPQGLEVSAPEPEASPGPLPKELTEENISEEHIPEYESPSPTTAQKETQIQREEPNSTINSETEKLISNTPPPTPRPTTTPEKSQTSQSGGGSKSNSGGGSTPDTPRAVRKYLRHTYEINSAPLTGGIIEDIEIISGGLFSRTSHTVSISESNFNGGKPGDYKVRLTATRKSGDETLDLHVAFKVVDTTAPVIEVENTFVTPEAGIVISLEEILAQAGAGIRDNSREDIELAVTGYEQINFGLPGRYYLELNAVDSSGNEAYQRVIIITVI